MQVELPDEVLDTVRDVLGPVIERLIDEKVEQRRPLLLSVTEVADELSCSRSSVYGLIRGGHLEAIRTGRTYRVVTAVLQKYVEELATPVYERRVVTAHSVRTPPVQRAMSGHRGKARQIPSTSVLTATRPPRPPRPKQQQMSKKEIADVRWTVAQLAERWWGTESATALVERSGISLIEGTDGQATFRYGDLLEWVENNNEQFDRWAEDFDPVLKRSDDRN
jgi:excisionase family DNA binding protein